MSLKRIAIAIDGPAAAGKSTVAKIVAEKLLYTYIDTGAMYRALTLKALNENILLDDELNLYNLLTETKIDLQQTESGQKVLLDEMDVTDDIRSQNVTNHVSTIAKHKAVREEMVTRQRQLANKRGVVMDGRDIGTHVIPDAEVKIFLIASAKERAIRRFEEYKQKGIQVNLEELEQDIMNRDEADSKREVAPLIKAKDATEIDTTNCSINDVVEKILVIAKKAIEE